MQERCVVELKNVNKTYYNGVATPVLFDINLCVAPGEFVSVVGASGSGKTTLLNIIGLLDAPTSGQVILHGRDVSQFSEDERAQMRREYLGFIFQFYYLLPEFTVLENALMPCRISNCKEMDAKRARAIELLQQVGLGNRIDYHPGQLSGGQQQRVAIVRALTNDPALVLADEPTGTLDSKSGLAVFELMKELNRTTGKSFLMVTHDEGFAREADRTLPIVDGRIGG
ncbi:MAG TPA: lipoprotein-releasing system ATP-binding protein LolD [Armatimonadetes bacterium]|nr:lipoprotein-releasing system ATP-binding protein LolD [Armatimonadota bacterium]